MGAVLSKIQQSNLRALFKVWLRSPHFRIALTMLTFLIARRIYNRCHRSYYNLPLHGPAGLPLVGCIPWLIVNTYKFMERMSKCGEIATYNLGLRNIFLINDGEVAKQLNDAQRFADFHMDPIRAEHSSPMLRAVAADHFDNDRLGRRQRHRRQYIQDIINSELNSKFLTKCIKTYMQQHAQFEDARDGLLLREPLKRVVFNIMMLACFGVTLDASSSIDAQFYQQWQEITHNVRESALHEPVLRAMCGPSLFSFFSKLYGEKRQNYMEQWEEVFAQYIEDKIKNNPLAMYSTESIYSKLRYRMQPKWVQCQRHASPTTTTTTTATAVVHDSECSAHHHNGMQARKAFDENKMQKRMHMRQMQDRRHVHVLPPRARRQLLLNDVQAEHDECDRDAFCVDDDLYNDDDEHIISDLFVIMANAIDTTSASLEWCIMSLCQYPLIQHKIYQQVCKACGGNGHNISLELSFLGRISMLKAFIYDNLRLYPLGSVPRFRRNATGKPITVQLASGQSYCIPPDGLYHLNTYGMTRMQHNWINQQLDHRENGLHHHRDGDIDAGCDERNHANDVDLDLNGAGAGNCIAKSFAVKTLQLILSQLVFEFEFAFATADADADADADSHQSSNGASHYEHVQRVSSDANSAEMLPSPEMAVIVTKRKNACVSAVAAAAAAVLVVPECSNSTQHSLLQQPSSMQDTNDIEQFEIPMRADIKAPRMISSVVSSVQEEEEDEEGDAKAAELPTYTHEMMQTLVVQKAPTKVPATITTMTMQKRIQSMSPTTTAQKAQTIAPLSLPQALKFDLNKCATPKTVQFDAVSDSKSTANASVFFQELNHNNNNDDNDNDAPFTPKTPPRVLRVKTPPKGPPRKMNKAPLMQDTKIENEQVETEVQNERKQETQNANDEDHDRDDDNDSGSQRTEQTPETYVVDLSKPSKTDDNVDRNGSDKNKDAGTDNDNSEETTNGNAQTATADNSPIDRVVNNDIVTCQPKEYDREFVSNFMQNPFASNREDTASTNDNTAAATATPSPPQHDDVLNATNDSDDNQHEAVQQQPQPHAHAQQKSDILVPNTPKLPSSPPSVTDAVAHAHTQTQQSQSTDATPDTDIVPAEQVQLCSFFGSAVGCKNGLNCTKSHSNPNHVKFCMYFKRGGCTYNNKCRNRHHDFPPTMLPKLSTALSNGHETNPFSNWNAVALLTQQPELSTMANEEEEEEEENRSKEAKDEVEEEEEEDKGNDDETEKEKEEKETFSFNKNAMEFVPTPQRLKNKDNKVRAPKAAFMMLPEIQGISQFQSAKADSLLNKAATEAMPSPLKRCTSRNGALDRALGQQGIRPSPPPCPPSETSSSTSPHPALASLKNSKLTLNKNADEFVPIAATSSYASPTGKRKAMRVFKEPVFVPNAPRIDRVDVSSSAAVSDIGLSVFGQRYTSALGAHAPFPYHAHLPPTHAPQTQPQTRLQAMKNLPEIEKIGAPSYDMAHAHTPDDMKTMAGIDEGEESVAENVHSIHMIHNSNIENYQLGDAQSDDDRKQFNGSPDPVDGVSPNGGRGPRRLTVVTDDELSTTTQRALFDILYETERPDVFWRLKDKPPLSIEQKMQNMSMRGTDVESDGEGDHGEHDADSEIGDHEHRLSQTHHLQTVDKATHVSEQKPLQSNVSGVRARMQVNRNIEAAKKKMKHIQLLEDKQENGEMLSKEEQNSISEFERAKIQEELDTLCNVRAQINLMMDGNHDGDGDGGEDEDDDDQAEVQFNSKMNDSVNGSKVFGDGNDDHDMEWNVVSYKSPPPDTQL